MKPGDIMRVKQSHFVVPIDPVSAGVYRIRIVVEELVIFLGFREHDRTHNWRDRKWNVHVISPACGEVYAVSEYMEHVL